MLDADLRFAAACCARWRGQMIDLRRQAVGALRELKQRWQGVTAALRERQPAAIGRVTAQRDVGFTALLIILSSWPDVSYPYGLVCGLPAVGYAHPVQGGGLLSQPTLDAERGFCTYPMRRQELLQAVKGAPFRSIPRCVITQSSGKQRIIDNADQGDLSADANKLVLCTPLRPAQHIRAVVAQMTPDSLRAAAAADSWESGESLGRRLVFVLVSMYFDDASLTDWRSAKGSGQWAFEQLNVLLGTPLLRRSVRPWHPKAFSCDWTMTCLKLSPMAT